MTPAKQRSISFLKKRNKKLLSVARCRGSKRVDSVAPENEQKFFGSFFQKRTTSDACHRVCGVG
jgi:hypothetical protein